MLGIAQVNLALLSLARFLSESGCKGTTIFWTTKLFPNFFALKRENFLDSWQTSIPKGLLHYIIIYISQPQLPNSLLLTPQLLTPYSPTPHSSTPHSSTPYSPTPYSPTPYSIMNFPDKPPSEICAESTKSNSGLVWRKYGQFCYLPDLQQLTNFPLQTATSKQWKHSVFEVKISY